MKVPLFLICHPVPRAIGTLVSTVPRSLTRDNTPWQSWVCLNNFPREHSLMEGSEWVAGGPLEPSGMKTGRASSLTIKGSWSSATLEVDAMGCLSWSSCTSFCNLTGMGLLGCDPPTSLIFCRWFGHICSGCMGCLVRLRCFPNCLRHQHRKMPITTPIKIAKTNIATASKLIPCSPWNGLVMSHWKIGLQLAVLVTCR